MKKQKEIALPNLAIKKQFENIFSNLEPDVRERWVSLNQAGKFEPLAALSSCQDFTQKIRVKNFKQLDKSLPSFATIEKYRGEDDVLYLIEHLLERITKAYNVRENMNAEQLSDCAELILDKYYYLSPSDLVLFAKKMQFGELIKVFERIDSSVILNALKVYCNLKRAFLADMTEKKLREQRERESEKGEKMSDEWREKFQALYKKIADKANQPKERKSSAHVQKLRERFGTPKNK